LISGLTNFTIDGYGATIVRSNANVTGATIVITNSAHWMARGLTFIGNRFGMAASAENAAFGLGSNVDWTTATCIYPALGRQSSLFTATAGRGVIDNIGMPAGCASILPS